MLLFLAQMSSLLTSRVRDFRSRKIEDLGIHHLTAEEKIQSKPIHCSCLLCKSGRALHR